MRWLLLVCALGVSGCAGDWFRPSEPPPTNVATEALTQALEKWRVEGKIAIQRGDEGWNARLRWLDDSSSYDIRLVAPLGRGTYQLTGGVAGVALTTDKGERFESTDVEHLMNQHLGWSVPVEGARYWMRGVPYPGSDARSVKTSENGAITDFDQDGWRVSILRRRTVDGYTLPTKLFLHYDDLKVRVVIAKWDLAP